MNPTISSADVAASLDLDDNFLGGTYTFGGTGTLTLGGPVTTRGYGSTTISGPTLAGAASGNLAFNVGAGSGVTLAGATTASTNAGSIVLAGSMTLDDTGTNTLARLATTSTIALNGGTLSVLGNAAGGTASVGSLNSNVSVGATNPGEGLATISVTVPSGGATTTLNFANSGTNYNLRATTGLALDFVGVGGVLGSAGGPQITFASAPPISTTYGTGMIVGSTTVTSSTIGFAIATDTSGTGWATYVTPTGTTGGIEVLAPTATAVTNTDLQNLTVASVADFTPAANAAVALTANVSTGSLRINPGPGASLALGNYNITSNALMLVGTNDFTITGGTSATTGALNGSATKAIWVVNPSTTLFTSALLDGPGSNSNPVNIDGPGFVVLTGTTSQFTVTTTSRLNMDNGTIRANATQLGGFGATGGTGVFAFRGGVLEITGGSDGTGAAADFTRPITSTNTVVGVVNWYSTTSGDSVGGSGGFSAYGSAASVNIGGSATPTTLYWGNSTGSGFVQDGESLIFGSTKSNARLDFLNPVALDAGTAGTYDARTVQVIGGAGGDKTVFAGTVSGSSSTDLVKTGTGTLVLSAAETFAGRTIVEAGTVAVTTSLTGGAIVASGGTITAGTGNGTTPSDSVGNASTGAQTWAGGGTLLSKFASATSDDRLVMSGLTVAASAATPFNVTLGVANTTSGAVTLSAGSVAVLAVDTDGSSANPFNTSNGNAAATLAELTLATPGVVPAVGTSLKLAAQPDNTGNGGYDLVVDDVAVAAPEPTSLLLAAVAGGPLLLGRRRRRRDAGNEA